MAIALVRQAGVAGGDHNSPQTVSISTTAGNTLVVAGHFNNNTGASCLPTGISDTAGNTWHLSTSAATDPPTQSASAVGFGVDVQFVAWCVNAAAVTSVTITRQDSSATASWWRLAVSEWSGVSAADTGNSASSGTTNVTSEGAAVTLSGTGELVVTAGGFLAGTPSPPAGFTTFSSAGNFNVAYATGQSGTVTATWTTDTSSPGSVAVKAFTALTGGTVNGTAAISGGGAVAAKATQGVTAVITAAGAAAGTSAYGAGLYGAGAYGGSGVTTVPAVQGAFSFPAGASSMTATGFPSGGSLAGAGALTAAGTVTSSGSAAIAGAGALAAPGTQLGAAAPAGAALLTSAVIQDAAAALAGAGTVTAPAVEQPASLALSAAGVVSAAAGGNAAGFAVIAGAGAVSAAASQGAVAVIAGTTEIDIFGTQGATNATLAAAGAVAAAGGIRGPFDVSRSVSTVTDPRDGVKSVLAAATSTSGVT